MSQPAIGTPWKKLDGPVSAEALEGVDKYWRCTNYLSVGQIYLRSNPLMRKDFVDEKTGETRDFGRADVKHRLVGHWGTTPGINFLMGHTNRLIADHQQNAIFLMGPGHGGPAGTAQSLLDGTYRENYPEITDDEAKACLDATTWVPANLGYFRGGGFSSRFLTRGGMPVTMSRINRIKGLGPVLQIAEGYTYEPPKEIHDILDKRTDPGWPTTWFVPNLTGKGAFKDVYSVMANWGANHGAFNYGHIGADLITLASMLRIPVCMHNVPEEKIFRPAVWNAFGMDKEGADYRACQALGPVYR